MKVITTLALSSFTAAVVLFVAATRHVVTARGVCYDPAHHADNLTADAITRDLALIHNRGFNSIRTFYTAFGNTTDLGTLAIEQGLNVSLGIPFGHNNINDTADNHDSATALQHHVDAAIAVANTFAHSNARVLHIFVGNENLATLDVVPAAMVTLIETIRAAVPPTVTVGTVQRNTELLDASRKYAIAGLQHLLNVCDVVGVNIHPVFSPNTAVEHALDVVHAQWTELHSDETAAQFPGLAAKLAITETGWPTAGEAYGNTGSLAGAQLFYRNFTAWSAQHVDDARSYYFQMFDQPQRQADGPFEPHFGLVDGVTGADKFTLAIATNSTDEEAH